MSLAEATAALYVLGAIAGGWGAWWSTSLQMLALRCAVENMRRLMASPSDPWPRPLRRAHDRLLGHIEAIKAEEPS